MTVHRPKSNTSLDERALTEAARPLCVWQCSECGLRGWRTWDEPRGTCDKCLARTAFEREVTLPEPPLDEWLKGYLANRYPWLTIEDDGDGMEASFEGAETFVEKERRLVVMQEFGPLLEALAEHRKQGDQHG